MKITFQMYGGKELLTEGSYFFEQDDCNEAAHEIGCAYMESVMHGLVQNKRIKSFNMTAKVTMEEEPKPYIVEETTVWQIAAKDKEEALAIWLDKGEEVGQLMGVSNREIKEAE